MADKPRVFTVPKGMPDEWVACHARRHWMESIPVPVSERTPGAIDVW
jgi:hypothetical protein